MKVSNTGELSLKVYVKLTYFSELRYLGTLWDVSECQDEDTGEDEIRIEYLDEEEELCGVWYKKKKVERIEIHVNR